MNKLKYIAIPKIDVNSKEGVDHINVSKYSTIDIGKKLAYGYPISIETVFGKVGTVRSVMEYIATPNYPKELLSKTKLSPTDIKKIPKRKIPIDNYWSIITYVLCLRVKSDKELIQLLKENTLPFTSYNINKVKYFDTDVINFNYNYKMGKYLGIIMLIQELIKQDKFEDKYIQELIEFNKDVPDKDIFSSVENMIIK